MSGNSVSNISLTRPEQIVDRNFMFEVDDGTSKQGHDPGAGNLHPPRCNARAFKRFSNRSGTDTKWTGCNAKILRSECVLVTIDSVPLRNRNLVDDPPRIFATSQPYRQVGIENKSPLPRRSLDAPARMILGEPGFRRTKGCRRELRTFWRTLRAPNENRIDLVLSAHACSFRKTQRRFNHEHSKDS
jgi:hypothetical protein